MKPYSTRFVISLLITLSCLVFLSPSNSNAQTTDSSIKRGKLELKGRVRIYGKDCGLTVRPKSTNKQLTIRCNGSRKRPSRPSDLGLIYLTAGETVRLTGKNCIPITTTTTKKLVRVFCGKQRTPQNAPTPTFTPTPTADLIFLTANVVTLPINNSVVFQVQNQSTTVTALNVQAIFPDNQTDVTQSLNGCASVAPQDICSITVSAGNTAYAEANVPIKGLNTSVALTQIEIIEVTTLSASVSNLALSVNDTGLNAALTGTPRLITITNTGAIAARSVTYSVSPALPTGSTISPADCGDIAPSDSCVLTITPGQSASSAAGDTTPDPIVLSVSGINTNTLTPNIHIITYGSVHQGGYLFSMDDTTPNTSSVSGKVVSLTDASASAEWGGSGTNVGASTNDNNSSGANDGAANTAIIVNALGAGSYAAAVCVASSNSGFTDWYLPAICEMGPHSGVCTAGSTNIQQQLFESDIGNIANLSFYWSSTQYFATPSFNAIFQTFINGGGSNTFDESKTTLMQVRCVRQVNQKLSIRFSDTPS